MNISPAAITRATNATIIDSDKNCTNICHRAAPVTLRTPISRARVNERAMERLVKLKHDVRRITSDNPPRKYTNTHGNSGPMELFIRGPGVIFRTDCKENLAL